MRNNLGKTKAGFTLVELIVVIAILGILAGIAVPVYSGYISKAGEAGDLQLLGALNTAYAAACAEMGLDPTDVVGIASLDGEVGNKTLTRISATGVDDDTSAKLNGAFRVYYGENISTPFKVYTSLGYDRDNGVFVDGNNDNAVFAANYNGTTVIVTGAQVKAFNDSIFGSSDTLSTEYLMHSVDNVVDAAAAFLNNFATLKNYVTKDQWRENFVERRVAPGLSDYLESIGMSDENITDALFDDEKLSNALVLYTANETKGTTVADVLSAFDPLTGTVSGYKGQAGTALSYAIAMGYAYQDGATLNGTYSASDLEKMSTKVGVNVKSGNALYDDLFGAGNWTKSGGNIVVDMGDKTAADWFVERSAGMSADIGKVSYLYGTIVNSEGFKSYSASDQISTDITGFLSSMNMIGNNISADNADALLANGFYDPAFVSMLQSILGD